jgi:ABC-type transport system substrate-binding protein
MSSASINDDSVQPGLDKYFTGGSVFNYTGFSDPRMTALIQQLKSVSSPAQVQPIVEQVQALWNEVLPDAILGATRVLIAWNKNVHGIETSSFNQVYFSKAWISH